MNRDRTASQLTLFSALVLFGVLGRWLQPDWNFTPVAAIAGFSAYYFGSATLAMLATVAVMSISNLFLPAYDGAAMMAAVYAAFCVPVLLGGWLRARFTWLRFSALCVAPPVAFFLTTNFAHWALHHQYPHTWAGLLEAYAAGVPFFRHGTLPGDVCYTIGVFAVHALAMRWSSLRRAAPLGCV